MHESWKICHDRKGGMKFKNCVRLRGLDESNYLAEARGILIHSAGKVTRFSGERSIFRWEQRAVVALLYQGAA